ncbi:type II secretion system protein [Pseudoalteromonas sp. bablab_jr004]|uniref:PulJ/GspJ family protein n=1 Tax=Pseudoalteromonas sp. bablab_jr004 TaxID=2755065 RepID=UPI0018F78FF2|nr:type II secretion system protein [Pseudoalteromonas sp. bablab_jr004]
MKQKKQIGFTLIELLIATIILFSSLAAVSLIYRGAFIASEKASNHVNVVANLPALISRIQQQIQTASSEQSQLSEQGNAWGVQYQWQASVVQSKVIINETMALEFAEEIADKKQIKLWRISLIIKRNGIEKNYILNEVSWHDA